MKLTHKIKFLSGISLLSLLVLLFSITQATYAQTTPFLISPYYGAEDISGYRYSGSHPAYDYGLIYQPVLAAASGTVTQVDWYNDSIECHQAVNSACGYGLYMYIGHSNGYQSRYAHLSATAFNLGTPSTTVYDGTVIGTSGTTGNSSGPHLHFEVKAPGLTNTDPYDPNLWKDGDTADSTDDQPAPHPLPPLANSGELIVDDNSTSTGGFSKGRGGTFNNPCPPNSCPFWYSEGIGYGNDMYQTNVNGSTVNHWARWAPAFPSGGGNYEVFVYVPSNYATSWQAPYTVVHADGVRTGRVDQYGLSNQWVSIGVYRFQPGNYVYTTDATGEGGGFHCGTNPDTYCKLGVDAVKFVRRDTFYQTLWRGDQGRTRVVPIINGIIQWGSASSWSAPAAIGYLPGSGTLQTQTDFVVGNTLWQGLWRNNQGWSRTIPLVNGQIRWASASNWSGPMDISGLPGSGSMETQSEFVVGNTLWQAFWRGGQGWSRTVPIVNGEIYWWSASAWSGPLALSSLPGNGSIQTQSEFVAGNTLWQALWRGNEGWSRTVPIVNGVVYWWSASAWSGPQDISSLPGSGALQSQSELVIP